MDGEGKMKKHYIIITSTSGIEDLEDQVNKAIQRGYLPHGSIIIIPGDAYTEGFAQPMVMAGLGN